MNLQPNLWTLLFVLVAAGWGYSYFNLPQVEETPEMTLERAHQVFAENNFAALPYDKEVLSDSLTTQEFNDRWDFYYNEIRYPFLNSYRNFWQRYNPNLNTYDLPVYFRLEINEIAQLYHLDSTHTKPIYASLILEGIDADGLDNAQSAGNSLGLVFSTEPPTAHLEDKHIQGAKYYNFSSPCPPMCDTSNYSRDYFVEPPALSTGQGN